MLTGLGAVVAGAGYLAGVNAPAVNQAAASQTLARTNAAPLGDTSGTSNQQGDGQFQAPNSNQGFIFRGDDGQVFGDDDNGSFQFNGGDSGSLDGNGSLNDNGSGSLNGSGSNQFAQPNQQFGRRSRQFPGFSQQQPGFSQQQPGFSRPLGRSRGS